MRPSTESSDKLVSLASSGVSGLDDVLMGGFTPGRLYFVEGVPGSGKTTLAFQFLIEGARRKEPVLYVTLVAGSNPVGPTNVCERIFLLVTLTLKLSEDHGIDL
jgi:RecA/RadA recombinase